VSDAAHLGRRGLARRHLRAAPAPANLLGL